MDYVSRFDHWAFNQSLKWPLWNAIKSATPGPRIGTRDRAYFYSMPLAHSRLRQKIRIGWCGLLSPA